MFPDVRLLIAATLASVAALICGFGLFAVFCVSHEPLGRLPPTGAPMQFVAGNASRLSPTVAPQEPFDRRFQISAAPSISETARSPAHGPDLHDDIESTPGAPVAAPQASVAAAPDETSALEEPKVDAAALPALQPVVAPVETTETVPIPEPASDPTTTAPQPAAVSAEAGQEMKSPVAPGPSAEAVAAPGLAATDPGHDWRHDLTGPPPERLNADVKPSIAENPAAQADREIKEKKTTHIRVAAPTRRPHGIVNAAAARAADQNNGFAQSNPETAPAAQTQSVQGRAVTIRHAKIASGRSQERSSAVGGPFVSAPGR